MSATIIAFPGTTPGSAAQWRAVQQPAPISATSLAAKFTDHYLPVVHASIDLLDADERDFEARCRTMLDHDGTEMIEELCQELQIVSSQMKLLVDGLSLTRTRLRTAMARLATPTPVETAS